jgi:hypothetical protein
MAGPWPAWGGRRLLLGQPQALAVSPDGLGPCSSQGQAWALGTPDAAWPEPTSQASAVLQIHPPQVRGYSHVTVCIRHRSHIASLRTFCDPPASAFSMLGLLACTSTSGCLIVFNRFVGSLPPTLQHTKARHPTFSGIMAQ